MAQDHYVLPHLQEGKWVFQVLRAFIMELAFTTATLELEGDNSEKHSPM